MKFANPSRLQKLRSVAAAELPDVVRFKVARVLGSVRQDLRVPLLRKLWPNAFVARPSHLRHDIRFFALNDWHQSREQLIEALLQNPDAAAAQVLANQACSHVFDLLGSGLVGLGPSIDWHRDFKSGAHWKPNYFKRIQEIELNDSSDIKVPWELSRAYHFVSLGVAYWLTRDEKYAREFLAQSHQWIEQNPPYHGVNWHCAMEVAIRAINWIWGYFLFAESPLFDSGERALLASSLAIHGEYIWNNLEFDKRVLAGRYVRHNGNHYISDLVGLIYLGLVLPGHRAAHWLDWALRELDQEMQRQVLADGAHWELSPSYHRLVLELVLPAVILCSQNQGFVPQTLRCAAEAMAEYTMHYLKPDGSCPLVRDADDGRVCLLYNGPYKDHRHLLALAAAYFERRDFASQAGAVSGDLLWLLGPTGLQKFERLSHLSHPPTELASKGFSHAGYYVLRSGKEVYAFVSCADIGMGGTYGGHAHNDALSFELFYRGTTFISDCGTYNYSGDPAARNLFRSTASHNTARIDRTEINRFSESELFGMENDARPKVIEWRTGPEVDYLLAEHGGFTRLECPIIHRRGFSLDRAANRFVIADTFIGNGEHLFELFFHFSPGIQIDQVSNWVFRANSGESTLCLEISHRTGWATRLEQGWISERYGCKRPSWTLVVYSHQAAPVAVTTTIQFLGATGQEKKHRPEKTVTAAVLS